MPNDCGSRADFFHGSALTDSLRGANAKGWHIILLNDFEIAQHSVRVSGCEKIKPDSSLFWFYINHALWPPFMTAQCSEQVRFDGSCQLFWNIIRESANRSDFIEMPETIMYS